MEAPFHVVFLQTDYTSLEEAPREAIAEHVARSRGRGTRMDASS
jgi:hypothetical protein